MTEARHAAHQTTDLGVAVVGICSARHLQRCLAALRAQQGAGAFEIVVAYDPELPGMSGVIDAHPAVRFHTEPGRRSPLELAAMAIRETRCRIVLLTEDHCRPHPDWVRTLSSALQDGRAAAGGPIELLAGASDVDWALYFADFFRYAPPVTDGRSPTLSVCNVAYRRGDLDALEDQSWREFFHETSVHSALSRRGVLYLASAPRVSMSRHVTARGAIRERYTYGRLFGYTRLRFVEGWTTRLRYQVGALALPALLLGRMIPKALASAENRRRLVTGFLPLASLAFAWSLGEWIGYVTGRAPTELAAAPEIHQEVDAQ